MAELSLANIKYSAEEYFDIDKQSADRYEYENGYIWAMAGTTTNHNLVVQNLIVAFRDKIKQKKRKCKIFTENIRLEVAAKKAYYYPDLMFTCNPLDLQEKLTLRNPSLVVEVLSDGSFMTDLNHKLDNYIKMPSLLYYLVVSQDEYRVRVWEKTAEGWLYKVYSELSDVVNLTQIDMDLRMEEVYEEIEMEVKED